MCKIPEKLLVPRKVVFIKHGGKDGRTYNHFGIIARVLSRYSPSEIVIIPLCKNPRKDVNLYKILKKDHEWLDDDRYVNVLNATPMCSISRKLKPVKGDNYNEYHLPEIDIKHFKKILISWRDLVDNEIKQLT